jgi:hypothetical protein
MWSRIILMRLWIRFLEGKRCGYGVGTDSFFEAYLLN